METPVKRVKRLNEVDSAIVEYLAKANENKDENYFFAMSLSYQLRGMNTTWSSYARSRITQLMYELQTEINSQQAAAVLRRTNEYINADPGSIVDH